MKISTVTSGPRERLARVGRAALSDAELLAVLLGTGTRAEPVEQLAARVLRDLGGLTRLSHLGPGALQRVRGLGPTKAGRLVAAVELGRRVTTQPLNPRTRLSSSRDVARAMRPRLMTARTEHFLGIALDSKHRPIAEVEIARGGLTACPVAPADVFRALLMEGAHAVVLVHNHPSGEPAPSPEDLALTERLGRAGELLGIAVLDHVIVGAEGYFSFLDAGLIHLATSAPSP